MNAWRRAAALLLTIALAFGVAGAAGANGAETEGKTLQLIADQSTAAAGGKVQYHLIYHNVENKNQTNTQLHVKLHEWMEVVDAGGAEFDATLHMLKWRVKDVKANGAHVVHFQVKLKANAKRGERIELEAEGEGDGGVKWKSPKISVKVDTETHQPFMQGYPDGTFRPDGELTRAETAAMVARITGLRTVEASAYEDVDASHWAHRYIMQVKADGYMIGYDGKFRPEDPITRAELLVLMLRLHGIAEVPFEVPYGDMKAHWARYALGTAHALGYIKPMPGEAASPHFAPDRPIERKVAAMWLSIGLLRGPLTDGDTDVVQHFPDVPKSHPYFAWIEEASAVAHESERRGEGAEQLLRYLPEATAPF